MSASRKLGVVIALMGLAWFVGYKYWLATRKLVPLDLGASLSRGHIRSPEFEINLKSGYYIEIEVRKTDSISNIECLMRGCYGIPVMLKARWALLRDDAVETSGDSDQINGGSGAIGDVGRKIGYFHSSGGRYRLDVDVLSDTNLLDVGKPVLKIEADGNGYNRLSHLTDILPLGSILLIAIGCSLLVLSGSRWSWSTAPPRSSTSDPSSPAARRQ